MPKDDEIVINMQAMKSMALLTEKTNSICGHKLWMKKKDEIIDFDNLESHKFNSEEGRREFVYNKTFEEADNLQSFIGILKSSKDLFPSDFDNILIKQLNNIEGTFDEIDLKSLNKTQKQILLFNMNKIDKIENPIHFLKNFSGRVSDSEYNWIIKARNENFKLDPFSIPASSVNLKLLRIFIGLKNKKMVKKIILKEIEGISNKKIRNWIKNYYAEDTVDVELSNGLINLTI
ncbi:hypothetical protein NBO_20g0028 [Nosema bombycis CQ1]|uniref:Uncharacterized protein n=1 Tax=Nosema bombycis (strain CQ1 / CVCC 102059) TaxID=578461 RepID=R0KUT9_NOSB1|nr:hypothetical protein NBO_20g0028 [Nosema bombycis CQ1]|eukprot:EOB14641.1 hypothetical protein NBO_20g0028 [Nosema bombycis CQ1]